MTDDLKAPERIWATEDAKNFGEDRFHTTRPMKGLTEYVRADRISAFEAALADMTRQRDAAMAGAVKVRELVWEDVDAICTRQKAPALGGHYSVVEFDANTEEAHFATNIDLGGLAFVFILEPDPLGGRRPKRYHTIEAAKAAAQADYNARIISALAPDPDRLPALTAAAEAQAEARGMRICADIYYTRCCADDDGDDVYREMMETADATEAAAKGGV